MSDKPLVELVEHSEGYHEVVFHDGSRLAVEAYMTILESMMIKHVEANDTARVLINLSEGKVPSITLMGQNVRRLLHEHRNERERLHLRGAFLASSTDAMILSLSQSFIALMPIDANMHTFTSEHRADAIAWLLEDSDG